jgi:hypothetical protein
MPIPFVRRDDFTEGDTMLGRSLRMAALAILICLGAKSPARADGPPQPVVTAGYNLHAPTVVPADPNNPQAPRKRFGCWGHHNYYGCGSFRSDAVFIFGSCRAFFGEACWKTPPPAFGPDYNPPGNGPGANGPGGFGVLQPKGCACP